MFGGFWADRVWGRFWGWDPKENAALLIVIWTAIYLLVRRNQLTRERIRMTLAASGTILTCVSWLGVNMMGVGLHSYGFIRQELGWLMLLLASQMVIVGLSLVPLRYWRSPQGETDDPRELDALQTPRAGSPFRNPTLVGRAPGPAVGRS
jgi:hypothetical protein